jgi:hypothetical protein
MQQGSAACLPARPPTRPQGKGQGASHGTTPALLLLQLCVHVSAGGLGQALAVAASTHPALPANQQTALRLACNCFMHMPLLLWLQPQVRGGAC